jgi:hypothetical protein
LVEVFFTYYFTQQYPRWYTRAGEEGKEKKKTFMRKFGGTSLTTFHTLIQLRFIIYDFNYRLKTNKQVKAKTCGACVTDALI